jgi:hypothetical protein
MEFGFSESNTVNMGFGFLNQGAIGSAPVNTVAPVISGTLTVGQTLTTTTGTWTSAEPIFYSYQWKRNGANIGAANNSTYVLTILDVQSDIICTVTATNTFGGNSANSNTLTTADSPSTILGANYYKFSYIKPYGS